MAILALPYTLGTGSAGTPVNTTSNLDFRPLDVILRFKPAPSRSRCYNCAGETGAVSTRVNVFARQVIEVASTVMRSLGLAVVLLALLIGAGVGMGYASLDLDGLFKAFADRTPVNEEVAQGKQRPGWRPAEDAASKTNSTSSTSEPKANAVTRLADELGGRPSTPPNGASFDIARISPDGVSVFAGRAKPFEHINILVGEQLVGTASADREGNWTLVTEEKIPDISAELKLEAGVAAPEASVAAPAAEAKSAAPASEPARSAASGKQEDVAAINKRLFASLQDLVDSARGTNEKGDATELKPESAGASTARESSQTVAVARGSTRSAATDVKVRTIPIPVQFVYREAEFTEQGREAVDLLLQYLKLSNSDRVTLSGHADERGSQQLNMDLSRERLNAVEERLRAGGYTGELVLVPKGESEPFSGVDRRTLSAEALYQLDRRVELRLER